MTTSHKVAEKLYLVRQPISKQTASAAKPVEIPTNYILITDCSGSMWGEIDKVREHIKTKLPKILKESDTLSLIAFSGRGECHRILTAEPVATLADLSDVNKAIDRWLRPMGLTGFKDPLEDAVKVVSEISKKNTNPFALVFMTDGCDNQSSQAEILKATEIVGAKVSSTTFVEYGYYANRPLLTTMAEKSGGSLIFSEDFARYAPNMEAIIQRRPLGGKRIDAKVIGDTIGGFAFALNDGDLVTYGVNGDSVTVPETLLGLYYLSPTSVGTAGKDLISISKDGADPILDAAYAAVSLFAGRMKSDIVFPLLKSLGDVALIEGYANCFGKQAYSEFGDTSRTAAFQPKARFTKGWDPKKVPADDAFTVLDVLQLLMEDDHARVLLNHEDFKYNKIGRSRLDADDQVSDEEQAELARLTAELTATKDAKKIKEISAAIAAVSANKKDSLKFVEDSAAEGLPLDGFTFNEDRPNVSFRVRKPGTVDLSARLPDEFKGQKIGKLPEKFGTFVYRNYAVIKDGLVNVEKLPVRVSATTYQKLKAEGVVGDTTVTDKDALYTVVLNLRTIPVINRKMVNTASAKDLFTKKVALAKGKAAQKVYNAYADELLPAKKSEGYAALYGDAAATWLKEQGLTEFSGFQPARSVTAPATDKYMAKELKISLKGLSTLPKVSEVRDKIAANGKLNGGANLMADAVKEVEAFLKSDAYTGAKDQEKVLGTFLGERKKAATSLCRALMFEISQVTFTTVVGQTWFQEFASLDEQTMNLTIDGQVYDCKVEMREFEVAI
jgi:hypothetical protein